MRAVLIVFQVCGIFAIALKSEEDVIVCSSGIKYDLTPGNNKFQCATSLFESLELICGGSGKFSRFKGTYLVCIYSMPTVDLKYCYYLLSCFFLCIFLYTYNYIK